MKEQILKEGAANWNRKIGNQGGKLILTNETLYFEAHKFNAGKKEYEVELEEINNVKKGFLNQIIINTEKGIESFVVNHAKDWVSCIQEAVDKVNEQ